MLIKDYIKETEELESKLLESLNEIDFLIIFDAVENRRLDIEFLLSHGLSTEDKMPVYKNKLIELRW